MDATSELTRAILTEQTRITVVGCSTQPSKAARTVPRAMQQHGWEVVPVNPHASEILGVPAYPSLSDVPGDLGLVNVFRPAAEAADVVRDAIAGGAAAIWLQLGIRSAAARALAEQAGIRYVEDRCLAVERARFGLSRRPAA